MRIMIFGGTTEGRELSYLLSGWGVPVSVSVATEYGREIQGEKSGVRVYAGRRNQEQMIKLLRQDNITACIDATHPYAIEATRNIRAACIQSGVAYRRLARPESVLPGDPDMTITPNLTRAAEYLSKTADNQNILLTIGAKELNIFAGFQNPNHENYINPERLFPRILPTHEGLSACENLKIPRRNIIAAQGPFSVEFNQAMIRQFQISYLVTKDGGQAGGFPEKLTAAKNTGIKLILIRRPEETGETFDFDTIAAFCRELYHHDQSIQRL